MAWTPAVPGFSPVSYGQGYGNWQQYAGYNKDNPFGVSPDVMAKPEAAPVAPPMPTVDSSVPAPDYSIAPSKGQYGAPSAGQFGAPSLGMSAPLSLEEQAKKHFGG